MSQKRKPAVCENCGKNAGGWVPLDATEIMCFHCSEIPERRKVVIRSVGEQHPTIAGQYLEEYDLEAHDGRGAAQFTNVLDRAKRFNSIKSALAAYSASPKARPLREDGLPNRPLRTFTVEIVSVGRAMRQESQSRSRLLSPWS